MVDMGYLMRSNYFLERIIDPLHHPCYSYRAEYLILPPIITGIPPHSTTLADKKLKNETTSIPAQITKTWSWSPRSPISFTPDSWIRLAKHTAPDTASTGSITADMDDK